jgi:hypothetical protein
MDHIIVNPDMSNEQLTNPRNRLRNQLTKAWERFWKRCMQMVFRAFHKGFHGDHVQRERGVHINVTNSYFNITIKCFLGHQTLDA